MHRPLQALHDIVARGGTVRKIYGQLPDPVVPPRGEHGLNPLHMHPADAAARGPVEGDVVSLTNANGCVEPTVTLDDTLRQAS